MTHTGFAGVSAWLRRRGNFTLHAVIFAAAAGSANLLNLFQGAYWWAFYPTMAWIIALSVHYFIFKSMTIDESWVDERAAELREHSYDFDHMQDLQQRIVDDDFSVRAHSDTPAPPETRETGGKRSQQDK